MCPKVGMQRCFCVVGVCNASLMFMAAMLRTAWKCFCALLIKFISFRGIEQAVLQRARPSGSHLHEKQSWVRAQRVAKIRGVSWSDSVFWSDLIRYEAEKALLIRWKEKNDISLHHRTCHCRIGILIEQRGKLYFLADLWLKWFCPDRRATTIYPIYWLS